MRNLSSFLVLLSLSLWSWDLVTSSKEVRCPSQQVDDWKFPQTARHNITGYNLVRRFSLLKTPSIKKIRNPRGPVILRLGKTALIHPTDQVFPHGLPDEFTLVFTLLLKKKTLRDNIYLFQISDEQGYPQFSLDLNGPDATLSLRARGADPLGEPVGCVFRGEGVESILDSGWHKLALSVQQRAASLHVDCSSIQTKPLEPRGELSTKGHTLLGIRATDAAAVEMDIQQVMVYCDASLAIQESCCEIPGARCPPDAPKSRRAAENDLEQPVLAFNQEILGSQGLAEKRNYD
nr:collagen alpha-1(XVI) chain-like [Oncorhynchus nerka]